MKCALASKGVINENVAFNKKVIIDTMIEYAGKVDIVIFGEAFLQGFYSATFDVAHDDAVAITQDDTIIKEIRSVAEKYAIAVSFGFIEKAEGLFYSSQITIDSDGRIIDRFRRVSPGWKETFADEQYCEGKDFHVFRFQNTNIVVGLCGDLWFDENVDKVTQLHPDVFFWPVYTDFNYQKWNEETKYEYAEQARKICEKVLYVNPVCLDKEEEEIARGGSVFFRNGQIEKEIPAGKESVLVVDV